MPRAPGARTQAGFRLRLSRARARSPRAPRPGWRGSQPLAHACRKDAQLIAVLGDGAARDLHAALREHLDDLLVGERILGVLVVDHLLDLRLDRSGAGILAGGGGEAAREEELERPQPARRLHVLLVG